MTYVLRNNVASSRTISITSLLTCKQLRLCSDKPRRVLYTVRRDDDVNMFVGWQLWLVSMVGINCWVLTLVLVVQILFLAFGMGWENIYI